MGSRLERKKQKKKRTWLKRTFLWIMLIFLAIAGYIGSQYYLGLKQAKPSKALETEYEFNAPAQKMKGKYNVLLLGIDARGAKQSRTDTIMIAQYDTNAEKIKLVSLMRDTYVSIPNYDKNKINAAFFLGGPELLRQTIQENFGIDVHYYAIVDFKGFEKIVDTVAPDGVEINVEKRMTENIGLTLEKGLQKLNGRELLGYARYRHDARGDFARVERQQKVLSKVKGEFKSFYGVSKLPKVIGTIQPYIDTNMKSLTAIGLASNVMMNRNNIDTMKIPVEGSWTDAHEDAGAVLKILDFEKNKQALQEFLGIETSSQYTRDTVERGL